MNKKEWFYDMEGWNLLPSSVRDLILDHYASETHTDNFEEYAAYYRVFDHTAKQYATYVFHAIMTEAFK